MLGSHPLQPEMMEPLIRPLKALEISAENSNSGFVIVKKNYEVVSGKTMENFVAFCSSNDILN